MDAVEEYIKMREREFKFITYWSYTIIALVTIGGIVLTLK